MSRSWEIGYFGLDPPLRFRIFDRQDRPSVLITECRGGRIRIDDIRLPKVEFRPIGEAPHPDRLRASTAILGFFHCTSPYFRAHFFTVPAIASRTFTCHNLRGRTCPLAPAARARLARSRYFRASRI